VANLVIVMSEEEVGEPEVIIETRGVAILILLFLISILMVYFGNLYQNCGLMLWGLVFLVSLILSLIPLSARIAIHMKFAEMIKEDMMREAIEEKIKKAQQENQESAEKEETSEPT